VCDKREKGFKRTSFAEEFVDEAREAIKEVQKKVKNVRD
jgi:hypothetical protein